MSAPPEKPFRIGVVGLGKMGLLHAATFNSLPHCGVVAAVDDSALPREMLAKLNSSIQMYPNTEEMLTRCPVDGVVIATPVAYHVPVALSCVARRVPFFMEKPLATSASQALPLWEALQAQPVPHMIGFMTRFVDTFAKAKSILESKCLGRLQRVTGTIYVSQLFTRGEGWRYDRKISGGGVLLSQGAHLLDLLTWYFGPVARVNAQMQAVYSAEVEDFAHGMFQFESGLQAWVDASWSVRNKRTVQISIDVLGDNGELIVTDDSVRLSLDAASGGFPQGRTTLHAPDLYRGTVFDVGGPQYTREAEAFLRIVTSGRAGECDIRQGLHIQHIVDAAYRSSEKDGAPEWIAK